MNDFVLLKHTILQANDIVLCLIVGGDCKGKTGLHSKLEMDLLNTDNTIQLVVFCYEDISNAFPRIETNILYYFAPKNSNPLFYRKNNEIFIDLVADIKIAREMYSGLSYEDAKYNEEELELYKKNEAILNNENLNKFPSTFTQIRNLGKDIWSNAKRIGKNLPILAPADVAFERITICEGCDKLTNERRCLECGCFMDAKVNLAGSVCPLNKWVSI